MARIRTIKPEFWTSEQIMECSPTARLLFIGLWNFCDDGGNHPASAKTIKAEVFPGDAIDSDEVKALIEELTEQELIVEYEVAGKHYWHVTGWHHQKIEKPTVKYPEPSKVLRSVVEESATIRRGVRESSPPEGKGEEGKGYIPTSDEVGCVQASPAPTASKPNNISDCPHQDIITLYAEILPNGIQPRVWNGARASSLKARWREDSKRQHIEYWRKLFSYIAQSPFLMGQVHDSSKRPFEISLDWIVRAENFAKIIEGKYHREAS